MFDSIKILVLNYSYEPLQFCSAKRGIIMVLSGRAEGIESDGFVVRSPSMSYPLPAHPTLAELFGDLVMADRLADHSRP